MTLEQIKHFVTTVQYMSFTKAAEKLFLNQSTISRSVISLENELGVTLILRRANGLALTDVGMFFMSECEFILGKIEETIAMTKNFATGTQRKLVIQVARYCYAPAAEFMKSFMEKYPDVDIKISTYNPSGENDINGELMSENTDIFFVFNDNIPASASASVSLRKVVDGEICVAVGKEHRLAEKKHITLADLQGECILGSGFMDIGLTRALSNAMTSQGYKPYKSKHTDGEEGRSMRVVTGAGVALVPDISDYDACWGVKKIPLSDFQFSKDMYMVWSSTNTNPTLNLFLKETSFITK